MTTLVGIVAKKGKPSVVMASDLASTSRNWEDRGDIAIRRQTREESQKIYVDKKNELAIAMSGIRDQIYTEFLYNLLEGDIDFKEATEKGFLESLLNINLGRFEGRTMNNEATNSLLIATRYDGEPKLWICWPLGKIEERKGASIGSGSEYASKYLEQQAILSFQQVDTKKAIDYSLNAVKAANADLYTAGLDLVVITPERIMPFGQEIKKAVEKAEINILKDIKKRL
jgi:hypothetical protein